MGLQLLERSKTTPKKTLAVTRANKTHSITFFIGVLTYTLRNILREILVYMKKAPNSPQITPKTIAAGKSSIEFSS